MAEKVEIIVTATDSASQVMRGITGSFGQFGNIIQGLTSDRALETLTGMVIDFGKESVKSFTEGAQAAKQLSMISGTSIEEASRFIQVLDDFGLAQEDALTATRTLTKEGLQPSLETLAKLSDQYRAIKDPQEKNEFILRNLGRSGLQWAKVLDQGSDALLRHGEAISKNLIFTEEMYDKAERLRIAQDDLNDSWEETKILVGDQLVPVLSNMLNFINASNIADQKLREEGLVPGSKAYMERRQEIIKSVQAEQDARAATQATTNALDENGIALEKSKEQLKAEEEAIKAMTEANQEHLSLIGDITDKYNDYSQKITDLNVEHENLITEKRNLIEQGWWPESEAVQDVNRKITENENKQRELSKTIELESRKMILSMLERKLAIDGLDERETNYLLDLGLKWGVYTDSAVKAAKDAEKEVKNLTEAINNVPEHKKISIDVSTSGNVSDMVNAGIPPNVAQQIANSSSGRRAGGGDMSAGNIYQVFENGRNSEYFQPSQNGRMIPGQPSGGINVNVQYSPMMSLGSEEEIKNKLIPLIIQGAQEARAQGRI